MYFKKQEILATVLKKIVDFILRDAEARFWGMVSPATIEVSY